MEDKEEKKKVVPTYELNRRKNRPKMQGYSIQELWNNQIGPNFIERFKQGTLGKDKADQILQGLEKTWDDLGEDHQNNIIALGNTIGSIYQDLRTSEGTELLNPLANQTAAAIRTGEFVLNTAGAVSDFTLGNIGRGAGWMLRLDPRWREGLAIGAQLYLGPKAFKNISKIKPKHLGIKQSISKIAPLDDGVPYTKKLINITDDSQLLNIIDDSFKYDIETISKARLFYKHHPDAGWKTALIRAQQLKGITNQKLIKEFTSGSLKKGGLFDPKRDDTTKLMWTSSNTGETFQQSGLDLGVGDVGIPGYKKSSIKKISTPEFIDKRFREYGFTKLGPNGGWILDPKVYNSLPDHQKREIAQIMQTDISQTVPHSFSKEVNVKNLELNTKLAEYNKKYGARAELHHDFPSALDARFWFNVEYMSDEWKILKSVANEYGNFPGQPMVEGQTNLVSLPSKIGKNHPNYHIVQKRFGKVPPHLHNIIHSQFFANETGMSGDKFFTPARVNKMNASFEGKVEVFREWNEIVARNSKLWTEGLRQLDVFFGEIPLENVDDLTRMLEEYLANDLIKLGSGNVKDRFGNLVKTKDGKLVKVDYSQFSVQDIVKNSLADFKADFKNDILGKNPRFKEAETEVKNFSQLSEGEVLDMANVLYKIKHYNGLKMIYGTRKAGEMVFGAGKNVKHYNEHLELYMGLIDDVLPNDTPTITTLKQLKETTFKDLVKPTITKQIEILFPDTQLNLDL